MNDNRKVINLKDYKEQKEKLTNQKLRENLIAYRQVCEEIVTFHYRRTPLEELQDIIDRCLEIGKENDFPCKESLMLMCFGYFPANFFPKSHPHYVAQPSEEELERIRIKKQLWYDEPPNEKSKKQHYASIKNFISLTERKNSKYYGQCKIRDIMMKYSHNYFRDYWRILNQIIRYVESTPNPALQNILRPDVTEEQFAGTIFVWDDGAPAVCHPVQNFNDGVIRFSNSNPYLVYSVDKLTTIMSNEKFAEKTWKRNSEGKVLDEHDLIQCLVESNIFQKNTLDSQKLKGSDIFKAILCLSCLVGAISSIVEGL